MKPRFLSTLLACASLTVGAFAADNTLSDAEKAWLARMGPALDDKIAYQRIQATRPQTLGVALTDSPVGLAAWIVRVEDITPFNAYDNLEGYIKEGSAGDHKGCLFLSSILALITATSVEVV